MLDPIVKEDSEKSASYHSKPPQALLLPAPGQESTFSVEKAIARRRSTRAFLRKPITISQLSQLLWAGQGTTDLVDELRSTPSAGALYPLEIYVFVGEDGVDGVAPGIYHYETTNHSLKRIRDVDCLGELRNAAMDQEAIGMAAVCIVISAVFGRTTRKYGQRGIQYVHQEAGASAQNVYLQATALGLGTVAMGAFTQEDVDDIIGLGRDETPLCILPIGIPVPE